MSYLSKTYKIYTKRAFQTYFIYFSTIYVGFCMKYLINHVYSNKKDQYTPTMTLLVKITPWNLKYVFNYDSRGMSHVEKNGKLTR